MNLCKCNNCGELFHDTNPQTEQKEYDIISDIFVPSLENHSCPTCKTDEYLVDFEGEVCESDYRIFECN